MRRSLVGTLLVLCFAACGGDDGAGGSALEAIDGVVVEALEGRDHIEGDLDYPKSPPSNGDHFPVWQNCGFYDAPIFDETAVHALEHGVVWLAYSPDLADDEVDRVGSLFEQADGRSIASPHPAVDVLEVVAWRHRLVVDDLDDPRIDEFIAASISGGHAPEPGASCAGGIDTPSETGAP